MSETETAGQPPGPVMVTQEMIDNLDGEIAYATGSLRRAAIRKHEAETACHYHAEAKAKLEAAREFITPRLGRPLPEVEAEVKSLLAEAEERHARAADRAREAQEHLRDVEGYCRIVAEQDAQDIADADAAMDEPGESVPLEELENDW